MRRSITGVLIVLSAASSSAVHAGTISGSASFYPDVFVGGTEVPDGSNNLTDRSYTSFARINPPAESPFFRVTAQLPLSFTAGTVFSFLRVAGFDIGSTAAYDIDVDGTPIGSVSGTSGAGGTGSTIGIHTLPSAVSATSITLSHTSFTTFGGTPINDLHEVAVTADVLSEIALTVDSDSGIIGGFPTSNALDNDLGTLAINTPDGLGDIFAVFDMGGSVKLDALLFTPRERLNESIEFQRPNGVGGWITFATYVNTDQNEIALLDIAPSVPSMSQVRLFIDSPVNADFRFTDFSAFTILAVPEPAASGLVAPGVLVLLRRRR